MPFAVFRRHQRKLLAIFAILAMFGFVLADSLPRLLNSGYGGGNQDPVVVELYGKKIHRSDINEMTVQRNNANTFMAALGGRPFFGDINTRSMVDALILQHEADKLKMPVGPNVGREWLKQATRGLMNRDLFEATLSRFGNRVSGEQILSDIANQVRILRVRQLLGSPIVTPLDVFQAYRDQNERVSARIVPFPIESYLAQVGDPTDSQAKAFYEKYKDNLPDHDRDTPGFKIPRQVRAEVLSIDGAALAQQFKEKLTEDEVRSYYENRKSEFKKLSELPEDLFANDPRAELTPPQVRPFEEVRPQLTVSLSDEKAQTEIINKFGKIKEDVMIPFADSYYDAVDAANESKKQGAKSLTSFPKPKDLAELAKTEGLEHQITPLLTREKAENFGDLASAEVGLTPLGGGRRFPTEFFDVKTSLFEPVELTDPLRRRYLARKLEDNPPRVPQFEEIRPEVIQAWKLEQARPLAEKAAEQLASELRKAGGKIKDESIQGHKVVTTSPITKLQPGFPLPGSSMFESGPPTPSEIKEIPDAGTAIRDAYFGLEDGQVAVAANPAKSVFYVMTLDRRVPATFATLYSPNGEYFRYRNEAQMDAMGKRETEWMSRLRTDAGVKTDWIPPDETERNSSENQQG